MLRMPPATLRNWLRDSERLIPVRDLREEDPLSFSNVVEASAIRTLTQRHGLRLKGIRNVVAYSRNELEINRPFLQKNLLAVPKELFLDEESGPKRLISLSEHGQLALKPLLSGHLERILFSDHDLPVRFFPFTRPAESPRMVAVDPRFSFGMPMTDRGHITTAVIYSRFTAGESLEDLSDDYGIPARFVEEALRYEVELGSARQRDRRAAA